MKPGIYNISNEEYHSSPGISRSGLMLFRKSPLHYWDRYLNPDREKEKDKAHYKFGRALHTSILEPNLFNSRYVVKPKIDGRKTENKKLKIQWEQDNLGKEILNDVDYEKIMRITDSIRRDKTTQWFIEGLQYEKSIYWKEGDLTCKIRPDGFDVPSGKSFILDIKSTTDASKRPFYYSAKNYGYFLQAAMLSIGYESLYGVKPDRVVYLAFEKESPYCSRIFNIPQRKIDEGTQEYYDLLSIYEECYCNNKWEGYPPEDLDLD